MPFLITGIFIFKKVVSYFFIQGVPFSLLNRFCIFLIFFTVHLVLKGYWVSWSANHLYNKICWQVPDFRLEPHQFQLVFRFIEKSSLPAFTLSRTTCSVLSQFQADYGKHLPKTPWAKLLIPLFQYKFLLLSIHASLWIYTHRANWVQCAALASGPRPMVGQSMVCVCRRGLS